MEDSTLVRVTTSPFFTWWIRNVAGKLDPVLFKATNGRFSTMGPPVSPMLTMTMIGRRSGRPRSIHLACIKDGDDFLIVASAMGQEKHPAWRYNLEANPDVEIQMYKERFKARAEVLDDQEKAAVWDKIRKTIPQMFVYEKRTNRNIRVFRIARAEQD